MIKKTIFSLIASAAAMTLFTACDAEKDLVEVEIPEKNIPYEEVYMVGYGLTPYVEGDPFDSHNAVAMDHTDDPNVFTKRIEMYYYADNKQFKFCDAPNDWDKIHYFIPESGVQDGTSYAYAQIGEGTVNQAYICSEMAGTLRDHFWGIHEGEDGVYDVTLNTKTMEVNVTLVEKKEQPFEIPALYIIGDGTPAGWDVNNPLEMTCVEDGLFTYEGALYAGEMKMKLENDGKWEGKFLMAPEENTEINRNGVASSKVVYSPTGSPDVKWRITEEGMYLLTVDARGGRDNITITAQYKGEVVRDPELFMLGNAVSTFSSNAAVAMDYDAGTGTFSWEGPIYYNDKNATADNHNKQFKFCDRQGDWNAVVYYVPASAKADGDIAVAGASNAMKAVTWRDGQTGIDAFWGISEGKDGTYRIVVDPAAMTVAVTRTGDAPAQEDIELETELYMQGVAGDSGCDSNKPGVQMTRIGETHTFYWEGELYYTDRENNRQFNFITSKGDWDKVYFLVPENGNSDSYREMVEDGGTYKMRRIKGPGNPLSASWGIEEKNNGMYRVEADLETMTVKVSKIK